MEEKTNKSLQYDCNIDGVDYTVKALITSLPEEVEITNIEREENTDFVFSVNVITEPKFPEEVFDDSRTIVYSIGEGGKNTFGYIVNKELVGMEENKFTTILEASVLEVLLLAGDTGRFIK